MITRIDCDWKEVKNECRSTDNKDGTENEPTQEFIRKLLISEHSPIRLVRFKWRWEGIKSWVATHFVRHHIGVEKWVSTQRTDRTGVDRDELPQDSPVNMDMEANAQALINMARFRLCYKASPETRQYMEDLRREIGKTHPEVAFVMVPNCVYRCGCPEFKSCGFFKVLNGYVPEDIESRYQAYENWFNGKEN